MTASTTSAASTPAQTAWRGEYVEIAGDGTWRFHRCLRCDGELTDPDNQEGYGPDCKKRRELDWRTTRREALKADRERYRTDLEPPQKSARPPRRRPAKRTRKKSQPKTKANPKKKGWKWIFLKRAASCDGSCGRRLEVGARVAYRYPRSLILCPSCAEAGGAAKRCAPSREVRDADLQRSAA